MAMKELNYIPNELARSMFKKRSNTIGMMVPNIQHPWFSSMAEAIEKELFAHGYRMMLLSTYNQKERETENFKVLKTNLVDGIICGTSDCPLEEYEAVQKPIVMLDLYINKKIPLVVTDHKLGGAYAARALINSRCKHVIHFSVPFVEKNIISYEGHTEFNRVGSQAGIVVEEIESPCVQFNFQTYYEYALELLKNRSEIDGIMAPDLPALAFLKAARTLKRRIPEEFAIVAFDGTYVAETSYIDVSIVKQNYRKIAHEVVKILLYQIENDRLPDNYQMFIEPEFHKGETSSDI